MLLRDRERLVLVGAEERRAAKPLEPPERPALLAAKAVLAVDIICVKQSLCWADVTMWQCCSETCG